MNIVETALKPAEWDRFIEENYPPVGAFIQTWAWGMFQIRLGRNIKRYSIFDGKKLIGVFTLVEFKMRFGLKYGYVPRGPVIQKGLKPKKISDIFESIRAWSKKKLPHLVFLRLEPSVKWSEEFRKKGLYFPPYYTQPRYNAVVDLNKSEEDILASLHSTTRSNIKRAEKRGVTVTTKTAITDTDYQAFTVMMRDTIERNNGINTYPDDDYFYSLFKEVPFVAFMAHHEGEPASTHFVLFFGKTATYLYGASRTIHLNAKVDTYLHWRAMKEAREKGYKHYDIGGIDSSRWPGLTVYKRQFKGKEFEYMGNIDIPFKLGFYLVYSWTKGIKRWVSKVAKAIKRR